MSDLKSWVSDNLMSIFGCSNPTLVQFVITMSNKSPSPSHIANQLVEFGAPPSADTSWFSDQIFARVDCKASVLNTYQENECEAAILARKQYKLVEDNVALDDVEVCSVPSTRKHKFKKRSVGDEDSNEEEHERRVKRSCSMSEDEIDQREKEELERHIKQYDASKTRKLVDDDGKEESGERSWEYILLMRGKSLDGTIWRRG